MMVAVVLMHRYHVGHNFGPDTDPLKPLLRPVPSGGKVN